MQYDKSFLRNQYLGVRKKKYKKIKNFNFNLIFNLIKKKFKKRKIIIAAYYPSYYEVNIINFLKKASKSNFKILLPVIKSLNKMSFKLWKYKEPLNVSKFGTLEPNKFVKKFSTKVCMFPTEN